MSVADWFLSFNTSLAITKADSFSYRYKRITKTLNTDFWNTDSDTSHSIYVGSYGRDTAIDTISDLDMAFWLPYSIYEQYDKHTGNGQSALLQSVRATIQKTYPTTQLGADGQVCAIEFTDGITFEVLPCFMNKDGSSFTYPDSNGGGSWKVTDPRAEITAIKARNEACNGNLKRLARIMRAWKKEWAVPMGGILIDTLAYQFIADWAHRDKSFLYYDLMSRDFFEYLAEQSRTQMHWKAPGSGRYVYRDGLFEYKSTQCRDLALEAIEHERANRQYSAKAKWREIFGTSFPS